MRLRSTGLAIALLLAPAAACAAPAPNPPPQLVPGKPIETRAPELAGDKPAFPGQTRAPYRKTVGYKTTVITDKLTNPWSLAFLPDGRMLVTEKPGTLRVVDAKGAVSEPLAGVPKVHFRGQVGLLDIVVDPKFAQNRRVFFSYMEPIGDGATTNIALASATLNPAATGLENVKVIFRAKPGVRAEQQANSGGRIAIAPDGSLFMTVGDRSQSPPWDVAQKLDNHLGKVIHVTADGAPGPGNPFVGKAGALPEIWSYGHRSEEGLAFDPSGRLWESEHGARGGDELNTPQAGKNYGWPAITHGIDYPGALINGGKTEAPGMEQPHYYWDPVIAPSGLAFYRGALFPAWRDSVLVGALRGQMLDRLTVRGDRIVDEEPLLRELESRIRDVRVGPDGAVYVLTENGKLVKLTP